jgi:hypothetical protein
MVSFIWPIFSPAVLVMFFAVSWSLPPIPLVWDWDWLLELPSRPLFGILWGGSPDSRVEYIEPGSWSYMISCQRPVLAFVRHGNDSDSGTTHVRIFLGPVNEVVALLGRLVSVARLVLRHDVMRVSSLLWDGHGGYQLDTVV